MNHWRTIVDPFLLVEEVSICKEKVLDVHNLLNVFVFLLRNPCVVLALGRIKHILSRLPRPALASLKQLQGFQYFIFLLLVTGPLRRQLIFRIWIMLLFIWNLIWRNIALGVEEFCRALISFLILTFDWLALTGLRTSRSRWFSNILSWAGDLWVWFRHQLGGSTHFYLIRHILF